MTLQQDLLEQAKFLAAREPKKPRQASLRRAVSSAYYGLFHLLVSEATLRLASNKPPNLRAQVGRAFAHGDMRAACEFFTGSKITSENQSGSLLHLINDPLEDEIREVAAAFIDLQQARHTADYNLLSPFSRADTLLMVSKAEQAFLDWKSVRTNPNANVFLAALLLHNRWRR